MARRPAARSKTRRDAKASNFRSGFEKKGAAFLDKSGIEYTYEKDRVDYIIPASKHYYVPDFKLSNGIICEYKGNFDAGTRKKMALVVEQNPDLDIRMVFMRDNKITKVSKTKYSDWCKKKGIRYTVSLTGQLPESWLTQPKGAYVDDEG